MFVVRRSRKTSFLLALLFITYLGIVLEGKSKTKCECWRGYCEGGSTCICKGDWFGKHCQFFRQRLTADSGIITEGPGKYVKSARCMWLIESNRPNTSIEITLDQVSTECSWDNLYVYDGSSVQAPLLAAYSGVLRDNKSVETLKSPARRLRSSSSALYLCFYSDENENYEGLKIKYSDENVNYEGLKIKYSIVKECSSLCSNHGNCNALGKCVCKPGWTGPTCNSPKCIYSCVNGTCNTSTWSCDCAPGYSGPSCNITSGYGFWRKHNVMNQDAIQGRASHAAGLLGDWLWVFGGYSLIKKQFDNLIRYSFSTNNWEVVSVSNSSEAPCTRYGHSLIVYNNSLIIFGGVDMKGQTLNDLWSFNTITRQWTRLTLSVDSSSPIAVSGHTANLVNEKMLVFFGYGPVHGCTSYVQEFNLETNQLIIYNYTLTKKGTYGHSSVYDPVSALIYVYAGIVNETLTDDLHSYDPVAHHWTKLDNSSTAQYLHSAVLVGHLMLVYGGNTRLTSLNSSAAPKCFDSKFLVYDLICGQWRKMPKTNSFGTLEGSLGQAAVVHKSKMFIFGGFNGVMLNDLLSYSLGDCSVWRNKTSCFAASTMSGCFWEPLSSSCVNPSEGFTSSDSFERPRCKKLCNDTDTCRNCKHQGLQCKYCDGKCKERSEPCNTSQTENCVFDPDPHCRGQKCRKLKCEVHKSCRKCVKNSKQVDGICIWCEAQKRCVVDNSYVVSFPYGQCNLWVDNERKCQVTQCSSQKFCKSCHSLPGCGWCDNGSGTGLGRCLEGGANGPFPSVNSVLSRTCSKWFFMKCPACQCNGHTTCNNDSECIKCKDNTRGKHCELCSVGFYGDAINGGRCKACHCNKHADYCDPVSRKCNCMVEGITGHECDKCDSNFSGNASNGGLCFYHLQLRETKVFNFTGKTSINLLFKPLRRERDLHFMTAVFSGNKARLNLTSITQEPRSSVVKEEFILKNYRLGKLEKKFSQREYGFHKKDVTFRAYIYKIDKDLPVMITALIVQPSNLNIDLLEFFLTFFGCFLSLLCVASIGWRIRSHYHSYLVTRQNRAERDRMANRPFGKVNILLPNEIEILTKSSPNPIAMEPLVKNKVAITTVVVLLPNGEDDVPPVGQCGICFASMLMSHGSHSHSGIRSRMGRKKNRKRSTMTTYHI